MQVYEGNAGLVTGDVCWGFQKVFPWGKLIAQVVKNWRQSDAAKPVPARVRTALELVPLIGWWWHYTG
jgi:hypothetical protein